MDKSIIHKIILENLTPEPYNLGKIYDEELFPIIDKLVDKAKEHGIPMIVLAVTECDKNEQDGHMGVNFTVRTSRSITDGFRNNPFIKAINAMVKYPYIAIEAISEHFLRDRPAASDMANAITDIMQIFPEEKQVKKTKGS